MEKFYAQTKEIQNNIGTELYLMQVYDPSYFDAFDPDKQFEKWAAIEVTNFDTVPDEMETPSGARSMSLS